MNGFISRNGGTIEPGQRVAIYRNLKNGLISIKDEKLKKVLGYCEEVHLQDVTFKIRNGEQKRAQRMKERNVHAFAIGTLIEAAPESMEDITVTYSPYDNDYFFNRETGEEVKEMKYAVCFEGSLIGK